MKTAAVAPHFVREAEAQHQYARIKIPAWLHVNLDGRKQAFPVADLSAADFSVNAALEALRLRQVYNGHLVFEVDGFDVAIDVSFVPRSFDSMNDRCGCEFQNLGHREFSALRHFITASLSDEVVSVEDVLNTLSRKDLTKANKGKRSDGHEFLGMPRAMVRSLIVMLVVLSAISFGSSALWNLYFVTKAESAMETSGGAPTLSYGEDRIEEGDYTVGQIERLPDQPTEIGEWPAATCCGTGMADTEDTYWVDPLKDSDEGETASKAR
ncbi:PilZ domain-containing protein [Marinobacter panjinensis]|uniref:PilZ domain-containing protein n=1 Tax=Marinobacter panjinensis TaxID=2576384 RepID=A0A4U6R671_9GAMM|nr:PilZ domain-containing protein [Marinobacter panjinensis]TKV69307.1 PilZ domain-containing protein [Marinobacter panjinensis]